MRKLLSCLFVFALEGVLGDPGTSFLVTLPQTQQNRDVSCSVHVVPTTDTAVQGSISTLPTAPHAINTAFSASPGQGFSLPINDPTQALPVGSMVSDMTMEVTASANVSLVVVNIAGSNGDAYTPIPISQLGREYYTVGGAKRNAETASFLTVSAPYDDTEVNITLPQGNSKTKSKSQSVSETFLLQGVTYFANDIISVRLNRLQTLQLQTSLDLTGARVTSSRPVSVLSGQNRTNLSGSGCSSHILEQMPPVDNWAKTFVLLHLPNQTAGDYYRFVAKQPMTTLIIGGGGLIEGVEATVLKIQHAGGFAELDVPAGQFLNVSADKPVLVAQYTREQPKLGDTDLKDSGDPSLLVLSGLEHARDVYHFSMQVTTEKELYVVFTARQADVTLLRVNDQDLGPRNVTWTPVTGASDYVVGHVLLTQADMPCKLGTTGGPRFNAHVYYAAQCECWALSLTHGQPQEQDPASLCPTPSHSPGDNIDNDCDGRVDEEPCCVNLTTDKDGDKYKNEDCGNVMTCCTASGSVYNCEESKKSAAFTEMTRFQRRAEKVIPLEAGSKIACGMACTRMTGCWGTNFALDGEGYNCELLVGRGMGLVASEGWGFQSMNTLTTYSKLP